MKNYWTAKRLRESGMKATNIPDLLDKGVPADQLFIQPKSKNKKAKIMVTQWNFNPHEGDTAVTAPSTTPGETQDVVMYIDELNPEVVAKIVEMHNEGKTCQEIDAYLTDEPRCTEDEREFITEQLVNYTKLTGEEEKQEVVGATAQPGAEADNASKPLHQPDPSPQPQQQGPDKTEDGKEKDKDGKEKVKRGPNSRTRTTGGEKKMSTEDYIKSLQEKIELTRLLDAATDPFEVPAGLSKSSRELMVAYQEEQEALTEKYINLIQKM